MTPTEARKRVEELAETAMRSAELGHDISIRLGRLPGLAADLRLLLAENERMERALREIADHPKSAYGYAPSMVAAHNTGMERLQRIARSALQGETP